MLWFGKGGFSMDAGAILSLLDRPIAVHRIFIRLAGSHTAGVMLAQAFHWTKHTKDPDGWFYKKREEWEEETCLKRREQENARKLLRATGFWEECRRGNPARMFYRLNLEALATAITAAGSVPTRRNDPYHLKKPADGTDRAVKEERSVPSPRAPLSDQTKNTTKNTPGVELKVSPQEIPRQRVPEPDDELITGMIDFLEGKIGPVASRSRETRVIKWLFEKGYDPVECEQCLNYLLSLTWRTTVITWVNVQREIGNWKRRGSPLKEEPKENGNNGNKSHFETASERNVRNIRNSLDYLNSGGRIPEGGREDNPEDETLFLTTGTEYGP